MLLLATTTVVHDTPLLPIDSLHTLFTCGAYNTCPQA